MAPSTRDAATVPVTVGWRRRAFAAGGVVLATAIAVGVGVRPSSRAVAKGAAQPPQVATARPGSEAGAAEATPAHAPPPASSVEIALDPAEPTRDAPAAAPDGGADAAEHARHHRRAPDEAEAARGLAETYEKQGKTTEAVRALRRYLELAPRARDRARVARQLFDLTHADDGEVRRVDVKK